MIDIAYKIIDSLEQRDIPYTRKNDEINCRCLTGTHEDKRPSMWINVNKNVYYCFSCQAKGKASDLLDIQVDEETLRYIKYKKYLKELELSKTVVSSVVGYPEQLLPPVSDIKLPKSWRGIPSSLLTDIGIYYCIVGRYSGRLIIPSYCPIRKEINGFDARIYEEFNTKYQVEVVASNAKYLRPKVMKTSNMLWVSKTLLNSSTDTIVLTEGVVDAISLLAMGYPAVANYGLSLFTPEKASLLYALGVQNVILGLDLDTPAFKALPNISISIKELGFNIRKPLPFVSDMLKLGVKDYNDYLQIRNKYEESKNNN